MTPRDVMFQVQVHTLAKWLNVLRPFRCDAFAWSYACDLEYREGWIARVVAT